MSTTSNKEIPYQPIRSAGDWLDLVDHNFIEFGNRVSELKSNSNELFDIAAKEAMNWAAIETGAIEGLYKTDRGFTFSVAAQANLLQIVHDRKGENFALHLSAQLKAYEFILDLATGRREIALAWIRQLHDVVCAQQHTYSVLVNNDWEERPLKKGSFKELPNNVQTIQGNTHHYCPVEQVSQQMQFMVDQTRQEAFLNASGVSQAAYVHHAFTQIHPFSDGNGRVARALASIFLYREYSLPMVVFNDQRSEYFDALEAADAGDSSTFVEFMGMLVDSTIEMIEISIQKALGPSVTEQTAKLSSSLKIVGNLSPSELQEIAEKLLDHCGNTMISKKSGAEEQLENKLQIRVNKSIGGSYKGPGMPVGYVDSGCRVDIGGSIRDTPVKTNPVTHTYRIFVPEISSENSRLILSRVPIRSENKDQISFHINEITPEFRTTAKCKVEQWCDIELSKLIGALI